MGGSSSPQQTTTNVPSAGQTAISNALTPNILGLANRAPPQYYPDATVAGFNPTQEAAQSAALGSAGQQADTAQWASALAESIPGMLQTGLPANEAYNPTQLPLSSNIFSDPGIWNPGFNEGLNNAITAATRPIYQQLTETALPAIRGTAVGTGSYGGSRQGIAEGLATSRANQSAVDVAAKMAEDEYNANLQAMGQRYGTNINALLTQGAQGLTARGQDLTSLGQQYGQNLAALYQTLGLTPTLQAAQATPAQTIAGVGNAQQQQQQAQLSADIARWNYNQQAPYAQIQELLGLSGALPGGSTVATGNTPTPNPATTALGGAATGAALGSMVPVVGAPVGAAAGAGAALLPFLFH